MVKVADGSEGVLEGVDQVSKCSMESVPYTIRTQLFFFQANQSANQLRTMDHQHT